MKKGNPDGSEVIPYMHTLSCIWNSSVDEDVDYMMNYLPMIYKPYIG